MQVQRQQPHGRDLEDRDLEDGDLEDASNLMAEHMKVLSITTQVTC